MKGKTKVMMDGRKAYIDGYVTGGDGRPCAVVVYSDGKIEAVYITALGRAFAPNED